MKNKERLNSINCELYKIKQDNSDIETLELYTQIYNSLEIKIYDLQEKIVSRVENIL